MTFREKRFNRKMRKREQQLRYSEKSTITVNHHNSAPLAPTKWPEEGGGEPVPVAKNRPPTSWECHFCHREFYSFPALINHKCND